MAITFLASLGTVWQVLKRSRSIHVASLADVLVLGVRRVRVAD
jgi:hypothetical protein